MLTAPDRIVLSSDYFNTQKNRYLEIFELTYGRKPEPLEVKYLSLLLELQRVIQTEYDTKPLDPDSIEKVIAEDDSVAPITETDITLYSTSTFNGELIIDKYEHVIIQTFLLILGYLPNEPESKKIEEFLNNAPAREAAYYELLTKYDQLKSGECNETDLMLSEQTQNVLNNILPDTKGTVFWDIYFLEKILPSDLIRNPIVLFLTLIGVVYPPIAMYISYVNTWLPEFVETRELITKQLKIDLPKDYSRNRFINLIIELKKIQDNSQGAEIVINMLIQTLVSSFPEMGHIWSIITEAYLAKDPKKILLQNSEISRINNNLLSSIFGDLQAYRTILGEDVVTEEIGRFINFVKSGISAGTES